MNLSSEQRQRALELAGGDMQIFQPASSSNTYAHARFTPAEVIVAISDAAGVVAVAAKRLGCSRATAKNYLARYPAVRRALIAVRQETCDLAQSPLVQGVLEGNLFCSIHYLRIYDTTRGYGDPPHRQPTYAPDDYGLKEHEIELID